MDRRKQEMERRQRLQEQAAEPEKKQGVNLWNFISTIKQPQEDSNQSKAFVFLGDKQSGKTSLIHKLLDIQLASSEQIKETVALDFKYANKTHEDLKVRLNTYELGGGRTLSNLLQAPLSSQNLAQVASICIVLDLSKPGNTIDSLLYWLAAAREYTNNSLKELQAQKPDIFKEIHKKTSEYWNSIPAVAERNQMNISMVPITIIGAKYDAFVSSVEPAQKKLLCTALRYICHVNACDLVFCSVKEQKIQAFKNMMGWHSFPQIRKTAASSDQSKPQDNAES